MTVPPRGRVAPMMRSLLAVSLCVAGSGMAAPRAQNEKPRLRSGQVAGAAAAAVFAATTLDVTTLHVVSPGLDALARGAACAASECGRSNDIGRALSDVGPGLGAPCVAAAAFGTATRGRRFLVRTVAPLLAGYGVAVQGFAHAVKDATARVRPDQLHHASFSFPSLHTATAVYLSGALFCVLAPALLAEAGDDAPTWRWRPVEVGAVAAAGGLTALGRVLTESHWLSDTVGGAALGVAALGLVAFARDEA